MKFNFYMDLFLPLTILLIGLYLSFTVEKHSHIYAFLLGIILHSLLIGIFRYVRDKQ